MGPTSVVGVNPFSRGLRARFVSVVTFLLIFVPICGAGLSFIKHRERQHELEIASDIGNALTQLVSAVDRDGKRFASMAGLPCSDISQQLTLSERVAPYVRDVIFADGGEVYCSLVGGSLHYPLAEYLTPKSGSPNIVIRPGTQLVPSRPALILYLRLKDHFSVGLVVSGLYVDDILLGARTGEASATVFDSDKAGLTSDSRFIGTVSQTVLEDGQYESPTGLFSVYARADEGWRTRNRVAIGAFSIAIGLMMGTASARVAARLTRPSARLLRAVRAGIERGHFQPFYQPIVDMNTGDWLGAEVLVRWLHPKFGMITPTTFIEEVERSPLIIDLTKCLMQLAYDDFGALSLPANFYLAFNISPFHAQTNGFTEDLLPMLRESPPGLGTVMEFTERGMLESVEYLDVTLDAFRSLGVKFAVDDFGTYDSNVALLQRFPFDYLKIDRRFVQRQDEDGKRLLEGLVYLGQQVDVRVVAEGVECEAQRRWLAQVGIPLGQGYLFCKPLAFADFALALAEQRVIHEEGSS
ncbi:putative Cyclic-guanylate-specific phosphodiesterase [Paraburkholderia caribensis]|uniref:EAL domain-containing protein n=1 Tax=Paraburkholderia caribensis TaxID=75105 RepID=UPI001CAE6819|nr:EAL domain-containing protein [Paraburkholderia caribensis]CAG9222232.1 putative Cyclic-guanylate-specific phosphodiesterase [Paraburkholderia caribensis]